MIDFCEIDWKTGDKWQEFAQIFLRSLGYDVIFPPGRGPDGGKDLLVAERLPSPSGATIFKWLVSCKHTAQSGSAIGTSQEVSIIDSMAHHQADGFMGFYSVGATQALLERLQSYKTTDRIKNYKIFSGSDIENKILENSLNNLYFQFFPKSFLKAKGYSVNLGEYKGLNCCVCGRDILKDVNSQTGSGLIVYDTNFSTELVDNVFPVCRQNFFSTFCAEKLEGYIHSKNNNFAFENLDWFFNTGVFEDKVIDQEYYVRMIGGCHFSDNARMQHNEIIESIGQYVSIFYSTPNPQHYRNSREMLEMYRRIFGAPV